MPTYNQNMLVRLSIDRLRRRLDQRCCQPSGTLPIATSSKFGYTVL